MARAPDSPDSRAPDSWLRGAWAPDSGAAGLSLGRAQMAALLEGRLVLGSASRLEIQFGVVLSNARQLRETYA